jgi:glycosyltransferase involved in cell wall biosynthesis
MSAPSLGRPPAVLQVIPRLVSGGAERGTIEVAEALTAAAWRAYVVSAGGPLAELITRNGGVHLTLPVASKNPLIMRRNVAALARIIRDFGIEIVHARSRAPAWSAWAAARATDCHFVTTFHNAYGLGSPLKHYYNSIMARGERVIAISDFVADHAAQIYGVGADRLRIIPRGVDLSIFDPLQVSAARIADLSRQWRLPDGVPIVMLPGRLTRWKGGLDFAAAIAALGRCDICCVMVGATQRCSFRRELNAAIERCRLGETLRIIEDCGDMPAAYMLADVVVSASTKPEGFGRIIVEAQAMGRPVVATDHGGARETIIPEVTGWLVPARDPAALAHGIAGALSLTPAERARLAQQAIAHVAEHFTRQQMCAKTIAVYEELLFPGAANIPAEPEALRV